MIIITIVMIINFLQYQQQHQQPLPHQQQLQYQQQQQEQQDLMGDLIDLRERITTDNLNGTSENNNNMNPPPLYTEEHFDAREQYEGWKETQLSRVERLIQNFVSPQFLEKHQQEVIPRPFDLISGYKKLLENLFT